MTEPDLRTPPIELPDHYRRFYIAFIRMSLIMLVVGGVAGILFQEMTHSLRFKDVPPGRRLESTYHLALAHGHSFLIGAVMPVCWVAILHVGLALGRRPVGARALKWIAATYIPGAVSVVSLILYKGMHYVLAVKAGEQDFDVIHHSLFGGVRWLRGLVYGTSHTVATVGLCIFAWLMWRNLGNGRPTARD